MKKTLKYFGLAILVLCTACGKDVEDEYSHISAYFIHQYTNTVPSLNTALNNMGEFTIIYPLGTQYIFANLTTTDRVNSTALGNYSSFNMGLNGFIVGLPNIPEIGSSQSVVVCYDRACSNCYNDYGIAPALILQEGGYAKCTRCKRVYNLNNNGLISSDTTGIKLFRYHVTYSPYTLYIRN